MPHKGLADSFQTRINPLVVAFGSATISTTAKAISHADFGFSATELATARRAVISCHNGGVHFRYDGGAPTGDVGHMLAENAAPEVVIGTDNLGNLQFIKDTGGNDAVLSCTLEN